MPRLQARRLMPWRAWLDRGHHQQYPLGLHFAANQVHREVAYIVTPLWTPYQLFSMMACPRRSLR
jgi:hypothetical protein